MNYYSRHLGDYAAAAGHLTALEHGIYNLLIDWYYANEQPIPDYHAHRIARVSRAEVEPILAEFFQQDGDEWRHKRVEREIAAFYEKSEKARAAANLSWLARSKPDQSERKANAVRPHSECIADAKPEQSEGNAIQEPITNNHKPITKRAASPPFRAPCVDEVADFIAMHGYVVDAARFCAHYESNGWKVGRNPMKSWQSAVVGWHSRDAENTQTAKTRGRTIAEDLTDRSWAT
jgi:uncharacterized protein YdaU (DUF1376 family)